MRTLADFAAFESGCTHVPDRGKFFLHSENSRVSPRWHSRCSALPVMYPLLISAATSLASTLIDKWADAREAKAAAQVTAPKENFAAVLNKSTASSTDSQIATLRQRLLDSPEVHTLMASADPAKQPALSIAADGTVSARTADGRTSAITLSPEGTAAAREIAKLTAQKNTPAATTLSAPAGKFLPPVTFPIPL